MLINPYTNTPVHCRYMCKMDTYSTWPIDMSLIVLSFKRTNKIKDILIQYFA